MFCPKCGNEIEEDKLIKFKNLYLCPKCGCDTGYQKPVDPEEEEKLANEENEKSSKSALIFLGVALGVIVLFIIIFAILIN